MAITIEMPRLSDSMHEGTVLRWIKKTGDFVEVGDHLADIETDKAHVELQACEVYSDKAACAKIGLHIGLVFQNFNLFPHFSVLQNITEAPVRVLGKTKEEANKLAHDLLEKMGLSTQDC